jgi:hypothetical protein
MGRGRKFRNKDRNFAQKRRVKEVRSYDLRVQNTCPEVEVRKSIDI